MSVKFIVANIFEQINMQYICVYRKGSLLDFNTLILLVIKKVSYSENCMHLY